MGIPAVALCPIQEHFEFFDEIPDSIHPIRSLFTPCRFKVVAEISVELQVNVLVGESVFCPPLKFNQMFLQVDHV